MVETESKTDVEEKVTANGSGPPLDSLDEVISEKIGHGENGAEESPKKEGKDVEMGEIKEVNDKEKDAEEREEKDHKVRFMKDVNLVQSEDSNESDKHKNMVMGAAEHVQMSDGEGSLKKESIAGEVGETMQYTEEKESSEKEIEEQGKEISEKEIEEQGKEIISKEEIEGEKMESEETSVKDAESKKAFESREEELEEEGKKEKEELEEEGKNEEEIDEEEKDENGFEMKEEEDRDDKGSGDEENVEVKEEKKGSRKKRPRETKSKEEEQEIKKRQKTKELQKTPTGPSIERPVRERKTVERLVEIIEKGPSRDFVIEKGKGIPLKDIPNVSYKLSRRKPDDLRLVHAILFGRKGKATDFKSHIFQFSGFVWHGDEDKQKSKVKEKLDKCVKEKLLDLCDIFDLSVSRATSKKEDLVAKLLDFLISPHATTDVVLAETEQISSSRKRRRSRGSASRSAGSGSSSKHIRKRSAKGEDNLASLDKNTSETEDESEDGKEDAENEHVKEKEDVEHSQSEEEKTEKDEKEDVGPKKKRQDAKRKPKSGKSAETMKSKKLTIPLKAHTPTPVKSSGRSSSSKLSKNEENYFDEKITPKKKRTDGTPKNHQSQKQSLKEKDGGIKGKEKTPSGKRMDSGPSKVELKMAICEILKEADFNTATFTDILKELAKHFNTDLTSRKSAIKLMIQDELTKLAEAEGDGDDSQDDDGGVEKDESEPVSSLKKAKKT